ncbi:MAG: acetyl-CoA C-acyltransferase [Saprospiraceae bacterium]|nr:acetyl-CoA C-acyltransferase [Saprospiraceae bacterium]
MNNKNRSIYIIDALRTPIGKLYGGLSHIRPDDLAALLIQEITKNNKLIKSSIDAVLLGCSNQAGEDNRNVARMSSILAGLPYNTNAITYNSLCTSGIDAILGAIRRLALGEGDLYLAGGVESMSRSPLITSKIDKSTEDSLIGWRFVNPKINSVFAPLSMPETAELLANQYQVNRQLQDDYAYQSRIKYQKALERKIWSEEIIPIENNRGQLLKKDEQHRILPMNLLQKLPKLVKSGNCISSGNAARIGDGAAILALASEQYLLKNQIKPLAKIHAWATGACHPNNMSLSAVTAGKKALDKAGLKPNELDWIEMSESFAVQAIVCTRELNLDPKKVNPNGGALTIGNPISVNSARMVVSLVRTMSRNASIKKGMITSCAGLGTGSALILEKV